MAGTCPLRKESAFLVGVHQPFLDLRIQAWVHQVEEREDRTKGVPEAIVREHGTGQYLSVVRAVMHHGAVLVELIELARKQQGSVEARIESLHLIRGSAFHCNARQFLVPDVFTRLANLIESALPQFLEVQFGLIETNE